MGDEFGRFFRAGAIGVGATAALVAIASVPRLLPWFFDPAMPMRALVAMLFGLAALAFEVGAVVGWPLAWVELSLRSVERGEARARQAAGESPATRVRKLGAATLLLTLAAALASAIWGAQARKPGAALERAIAEAREGCQARGIARAPMLDARWVCVKGETPRLVGAASEHAWWSASSAALDDDLSGITLQNAQLSLIEPEATHHLRARTLRITGLPSPLFASPLASGRRAFATSIAALAIALSLSWSTLRGARRSRVMRWTSSLVASMGTLFLLRTLELSAWVGWTPLLLPIAALALAMAAGRACEQLERC